jgi:hypothetical protein
MFKIKKNYLDNILYLSITEVYKQISTNTYTYIIYLFVCFSHDYMVTSINLIDLIIEKNFIYSGRLLNVIIKSTSFRSIKFKIYG